MNKYAEAAETCEEYAKIAKQMEAAVHADGATWPVARTISSHHELAAQILRALADGAVLVPSEPTGQMIDNMTDPSELEGPFISEALVRAIYAEALAASPLKEPA